MSVSAEAEERVRSGEIGERAWRAQAAVEEEALRAGLWAALDGVTPWVGVEMDGDRAVVRWSGVEETGFEAAILAGFEAFEAGMRERLEGAVRDSEAAALRGEDWRPNNPDVVEFDLRAEVSDGWGVPGRRDDAGSGSDIPRSSRVQLAAAGDLRCDGFGGGCQLGGNYGATATHSVSNRNLCRECASRFMGLGSMAPAERLLTLDLYLIDR